MIMRYLVHILCSCASGYFLAMISTDAYTTML